MDISRESMVGDIVVNNYKTGAVFQEYGIDYCCKGNRKIEDACQEENVVVEDLLTKLASISMESQSEDNDYISWELDRLANHIQEKHHKYVEQAITELKPLLAKMVEVHGEKHPELLEVQEIFNQMAGELVVHMKKEELMLFPGIKKMVRAKNSGEVVNLRSVKSPIMAMVHDHDAQSEMSKALIQTTDNFTSPGDACNTYRVTYAKLKEFMDDLYMHLHLENNILFPKAEILETELMS